MGGGAFVGKDFAEINNLPVELRLKIWRQFWAQRVGSYRLMEYKFKSGYKVKRGAAPRESEGNAISPDIIGVFKAALRATL